MSVTDSQYAAFVDRVIACREAEDRAKEDTKVLYAEISAAGEDKSAIGILVRELRMSAKDRTKAQFRDAAVDDGRTRYRRGKASHVRVREAEAAGADLETGEIPETDIPVSTKPAGNDASGAEEETQVATSRASSSANKPEAPTPLPEATVNPVAHVENARGAKTSEQEPSEPEGSGGMHGRCEPIPPTQSPPAEGNTPTSAGHGDRGAVVPSAAPVVADRTKPNPICQDPEDCGVEASWNHVCGSCLRRRAQTEAARAVQ